MARLNARHGKAHSDEDEFDDAARTPNITMPSPSKGRFSILNVVGRTLFGRRDLPEEKPPAPEGEELDDDDDQGGFADDVGSEADVKLSNSRVEVQIPRHISVVEPVVKPARKKRKNVYDISDDGEEPIDDPQPPQKKRKAVKPVGKVPISSRSARVTATTTQPEEPDPPGARSRLTTTSNARRKGKGKAKATVPAATGPSAAPRRRGRPPGNTKKRREPSVEVERQSSVDEPIVLDAPAEIPTSPELLRNEDDSEGVSDIIMAQSPAKNQPPPTRGHYARLLAKSKPREIIGESKARARLPLLSDHGDFPENSEGSERQHSRGDVGGSSQGQSEEEDADEADEDTLPLNSEPLVAIDFFNKMLAVANRVGYSYADGEERLLLKPVDKTISTNPGKRMSTKLSKLKDAYQGLREAKVSENEDGIKIAQVCIKKCIKDLEDEVLSILETRFKNPDPTNGNEYDSPKRTKNILRDIYIKIIPQFIEVIIASTRLNPLQKSMATSNVEEIRDLVDTFYLLVNTACNLPRSHQPTTKDLVGKYGTKTFKIQQPAISLRPKIRTIRSILRLELEDRDHAAELEKIEVQRLENERKLRERERRDRLERRRKIRENHRLQRAAYEEHVLWTDPFWAPIMKRNIEEDDLRHPTASQASNYPRLTNNHSRQRQNGHHDQDQDGSEFADDVDLYENEERVRGVFPSHNRNDRTRPWKKSERIAFMELMQEHQGDDRYSKAAEALQRSLDEIFAQAKEIQGFFDEMHEKGKFNEECDEWTYDVWIEPRAPR